MPDDFTLSNARRFYSSKGDPLGLKGLKSLSPLKDVWTPRISEFFIWFAFSATSDGKQGSLDSTKSGHCQTDNMKMQIYICNGTQGKFFLCLLLNKCMSYMET